MANTAKEDPDRRLELVREFVNTKDFDHDTDGLASPGKLAGWLIAKGLAGDDQGANGHATGGHEGGTSEANEHPAGGFAPGGPAVGAGRPVPDRASGRDSLTRPPPGRGPFL